MADHRCESSCQRASITVEDLKKSEDFDLYFKLTIVLVDERGQLRVGYFEFLPPSMMD